ncbi:MAG: LptF/LptG family permease [Muribaculaceae bacterium]|nr:LptF/LptG family permease [Muribaculaceae bacterium]
MLQTFLPLFTMTFFIVLFIVLMQFLWKYIDDLVGKGLEISVIGELFFYAAVSMVPMSLPLAILLASLMTFGNLGEKFELTAMKASGISLLRVMAPLIFLVSTISVGAFFFQNNILPHAQVKMWTLLFSIKQKSPELEIPEGVFYSEITGYNLLVQRKNHDTGMLYDVMIYDVSKGGDNATIMLADSAQLAFTKEMSHLYLHLYTGEQFENLQDQRGARQNIPYRRETFFDKEILIPFDANFNRLDDDAMRRQYVGKNIAELRHTIDSINHRVDSTGDDYARILLTKEYVGITHNVDSKTDSILPYKSVVMPARDLNIDSIFQGRSAANEIEIVQKAIADVKDRQQEYEFKALSMNDDRVSIRRHEIELVKKFTLSVACLIFFFIGAPLGAIIRKGGIGTPLVISVFLFIFYYIIDNTGYKMARDGHWEVWQGMWISTAVLAPLGIYVTYKAMNDSAVLNPDAWKNALRRLIGTHISRSVAMKEVIIDEISTDIAISRLDNVIEMSQNIIDSHSQRQSYLQYFTQGFDMTAITELSETLDDTIEYMTSCRDQLVVNKLSDFPILRHLWIYRPARTKAFGYTLAAIFPIGAIIYLVGTSQHKQLKGELKKIIATCDTIKSLL